jgi:hypothetical protein
MYFERLPADFDVRLLQYNLQDYTFSNIPLKAQTKASNLYYLTALIVMFNSLKTVTEIIKTTPKLSEWLLDADKYLAHTSGLSFEKLEEHVDLVILFCKTNCV